MRAPSTNFFYQFQLKIFLYLKNKYASPFFSWYLCLTISMKVVKTERFRSLFLIYAKSQRRAPKSLRSIRVTNRFINHEKIKLRSKTPTLLPNQVLDKFKQSYGITQLDHS
jgi:hypothetical protein